ncbi:MAG: methyltransferase domain-containing protein [Candidatus Gracilibacteria bacterium]|nr:methyltransferase domain-containing protein [Candidatus Gracilibacteria bacterium]
MKSMDLFGEALYDYYKGKQKTPFCLIDKNGEKFEQDLSWYFRNNEGFDSIEKALFDNIKGNNLLDIGCATAYYFPILSEKVKNIEGIDISSLAIKTAHEKGYKNTKVLDIMNEDINKKYDIITLMGNNLSIGGDIEGTKKLISKLKKILSENGKILSIFKKEDDEDYFILEFICEYNGKKSESFKWIRINLNYLEKLLNEQGLKLKVLSENDYGSCLEIKYI